MRTNFFRLNEYCNLIKVTVTKKSRIKTEKLEGLRARLAMQAAQGRAPRARTCNAMSKSIAPQDATYAGKKALFFGSFFFLLRKKRKYFNKNLKELNFLNKRS